MKRLQVERRARFKQSYHDQLAPSDASSDGDDGGDAGQTRSRSRSPPPPLSAYEMARRATMERNAISLKQLLNDEKPPPRAQMGEALARPCSLSFAGDRPVHRASGAMARASAVRKKATPDARCRQVWQDAGSRFHPMSDDGDREQYGHDGSGRDRGRAGAPARESACQVEYTRTPIPNEWLTNLATDGASTDALALPPSCVLHPSVLVYEPRVSRESPDGGRGGFQFAYATALVKVSGSGFAGVVQGGEKECFTCFVFDANNLGGARVERWEKLEGGSLCVLLRDPAPLFIKCTSRVCLKQTWGQPIQVTRPDFVAPLFETDVDCAFSLTVYNATGHRLQRALHRHGVALSTHQVSEASVRFASRDDAIVDADNSRALHDERSGDEDDDGDGVVEDLAQEYTLRVSAFRGDSVRVCAYVDSILHIH